MKVQQCVRGRSLLVARLLINYLCVFGVGPNKQRQSRRRKLLVRPLDKTFFFHGDISDGNDDFSLERINFSSVSLSF